MLYGGCYMKLNKNITYIILIVFFAFVFLVTSVLFKVFGITNIWSQITGTLLGTIITAIVTVSLLNAQTDKEISHDRDVGIFEEKQKTYHKFIETLENITQDGKINIPGKDNADKNDELQHLIYQLGYVQMHANHDLAERITESVGDLISTVSQMNNGESQKKNEIYSDLAENVFNIVSLLRNDLYNSDFEAVSKECFNSTLRATGAFDDELLSDGSRAETLFKFLSYIREELEEKKYKTVILFNLKKNDDIKSISRAYLSHQWIQFKVMDLAGEHLKWCFVFDNAGWVNTKFYVDIALKEENITLLSEYNTLLPKDVSMNFIDISNDGYKSFARLSDNGKKAFVRKYVKNIESKIESITSNLG